MFNFYLYVNSMTTNIRIPIMNDLLLEAVMKL